MTATDTTSPVGEERPGAHGAADPVAAREAMVSRLETAGQLRPGAVREALLAIRREVLIPQAYVRRSAPGGRSAAVGLAGLVHAGRPGGGPRSAVRGWQCARAARRGAVARTGARGTVGRGDLLDVVGDGHDRRAAAGAGSASGAAGVGRRHRSGHHRGDGLPGLRRCGGGHSRPGPASRRVGGHASGRSRVPSAPDMRGGRGGLSGPRPLRPDPPVVRGTTDSPALAGQLAPGGRLLAHVPTASPSWPALAVVERTPEGTLKCELRAVEFAHRAGHGVDRIWLTEGFRHRIATEPGTWTYVSARELPSTTDRGFWLAADHLLGGSLVRDFGAEHLTLGAPGCGSWLRRTGRAGLARRGAGAARHLGGAARPRRPVAGRGLPGPLPAGLHRGRRPAGVLPGRGPGLASARPEPR